MSDAREKEPDKRPTDAAGAPWRLRSPEERRDKWLRIDKWRSVAVFDEDQEDIDAQNG
jgi:hypothetical protein